MDKICAFLLLTMLVPAGIALGQDDDACQSLITSAYALTQDACEGIHDGEACYGNARILAQPASLDFDSVGDRVELADLHSLRLSSIDVDQGEWGISLMRITANMSDTATLVPVEIILFGNVEIENAVGEAYTIEAVPQFRVNLRQEPSTESAIVNVVEVGHRVVVNGRNAASDWLRVAASREDGRRAGWTLAELLLVEGDPDPLLVIDSSTAQSANLDFAPMQAFYFRGNEDDTPCRQVADNGILIQTPRGVGEITLLINEVVVDLGSTAYVQGGDNLVFNVLDGQATVTANGAEVTAPAGTFTSIALDDSGNANRPPEFAQPYDPDDLQTLPINLLPDGITIAEIVGQGDYFSLHDCGGGVWFVPDGASFSVELSAGGYATRESAQNAGLGGVLRIDGGPAIPLSRTGVYSEPRNHHYLAIWDMEDVPPGVYHLEGEFNTGIRGTCTMVVGS